MSARLVTAVAAASLALQSGPSAATQSAGNKSVYVAVLDQNGQPVKGLTAANFAVREDGMPREIVSLAPATEPLHVTLLGDTTRQAGNTGMMTRVDAASGGTELIRDIRNSFTSFTTDLLTASPKSEISVMEFGQAAIRITDFTSDVADVRKGISRLFPKPDAPSVLLEALIEANKQIARQEGPRRALVVINIEPGEEQSREEPNKIIEAFRNSHASLWAASLQKGSLRNPARDLVLSRLTQITGGRREFILSPAALENLLKSYAAALTSQYQLVYARPASDKPPQVLQVGSNAGKVYANAFAPK